MYHNTKHRRGKESRKIVLKVGSLNECGRISYAYKHNKKLGITEQKGINKLQDSQRADLKSFRRQ